MLSVYEMKVTLLVESDHTEILNLGRWMSTRVKDPAEAGIALVNTLNQMTVFWHQQKGKYKCRKEFFMVVLQDFEEIYVPIYPVKKVYL